MPISSGLQSPVEIPHFFARSFGDPLSHLIWSDDNQLRCGILPSHAQFVESLLSEGVLDDLVRAQFLASFEIVANTREYPITLSLRSPNRVSYIYEWSYEAWKDAAVFYLDCLSFLLARGLTLRNPHIWNLSYGGSGFRLLSPGSIVPFSEDELSRSLQKLERFLLNPLKFAANGNGKAARSLLRDIHEGVPSSLVQGRVADQVEDGSAMHTLKRYRDDVEALRISSPPAKWIEYYEERRFAEGSSWNLKADILRKVMNEIRPASVLDIGGNTGYYSRIAVEHCRTVICCDVDDYYISRLHCELKELPAAIVPLVLDITNPSPALGVDGGWFPSASERMGAELVLAFALEHHLVFGKYRLNFDQFARAIWSFTTRCAVVEFVPPYENLHHASWRPECVEWYHPEGFQRSFQRYFERVVSVSKAPDGRELFRCDWPVSRRSL
jgi:hypothetical protein